MKYEKILVPTDFLACANNALKLAVEMADRHDSELHLVHAISPTIAARMPAAPYDIHDRFLHDTAQSLLETKKDILLKFPKLKIETFSGVGGVCKLTDNYVNEHQIDLVVMGTHGASGFKEFFIGSNSYDVIKEIICPVLTVPESFNKSLFTTILYPIRNVEGVIEKFDYIKPLVEKNISAIHLLGIVDNNQDLREERQALTRALQLLKEQLQTVCPHYIVDDIVHSDNLAETILLTGKEVNADLVVINATLDTNWHKFFSGSFTQQIVNHSKWPVLSVKPVLTEQKKAEIALRNHESEIRHIPFDW